MPLTILQNYTACGPNRTVPFGATGGATPYVWSVAGGGAGGSINASTGMYTAASVPGIDTIQVSDGSTPSATASTEILIGSAFDLLCDIIQTELSLSQGRVYIYNQKINMPTDSGLFIPIKVLGCKAFGNDKSYDTTSGFVAVQSVNMQAMLSIDIISRSTDALTRKEEVVMALMSDYAQRQMELNSFYLGRIPFNFTDISDLDGSAQLYRFNISVNMLYTVKKTQVASYYDTFPALEIHTDPEGKVVP